MGVDEYQDFKISNAYNSYRQLPTMCLCDFGITGRYACKFDHYGDMEAFGVHPDYTHLFSNFEADERRLSKFASVQGHLREWNPNTMAKIQKLSRTAIKALNFGGIRIDKTERSQVRRFG